MGSLVANHTFKDVICLSVVLLVKNLFGRKLLRDCVEHL